MLRKNSHIVIIALAGLIWVACSTQKNTFVTRSYHNTTAHYNGYFWGNLSYDEGQQKLKDNHVEDFSSRLPVFVYADDKEAQSIYPEMDRAIKKATTMIENHTITNKQKREIPDAVKYIKYCYLLLAKARISKNEYLTAIEALDYAARTYRKTGVKYEAIMWEARAYNQIGAVSKAQELVDLMRSAKVLPKNLIPDICATAADYFSRTGEDAEEEKWLLKAVKVEKHKKVKSRYYYILAQISQESGDKRKAFELYTTVLKNKPPYNLDFEANINRALLFMGDEKENQNIKKMLVKMLRPTKNIDNRDQIYYALAQISEKEGDTVQAQKYLVKSVRSSTTNTRQKAISYLALADLNFYQTNYVPAKKYYDSTLLSLPKNYKGRDSIVDKRDNLQKLVKYLDIINMEDSVLRLSKMSKKDLEKYIDKLIADQKKADEEKKKQEQLAAEQANNVQPPNPNVVNTQSANGKWYFYNPMQMQMGTTEFNQKWGNRVLEDNWRRSKKQAVFQQGNNPELTKKEKDSMKVADKKTKDSLNNAYGRAYYMKNIPQNDAQLKAANDSLADAYYNAGSIYKEYLKNYPKAAAEFEALLQRYPDNKYLLSVYYQLYRMYYETGNTEKANYYKNIILSKYPNTEYAQLIQNPEKYAANVKASKQEMEKLYTATLESYEAAKYLDVLNNCHRADSLYPKNPLAPKFAYLEAVATGYTQGLEAYKSALTKVMILYPRDSVKYLAQNTLQYLNRKPVTPGKDTGVSYSMEDDTNYYWVAIIDNKQAAKINDFRNDITDLNAHVFSQSNLQMDNMLLNPDQDLLLLRRFKTKAEAKNYHGYMSNNKDVFKSLPAGTYQTFYITGKNFKTMFNHHKADEYIKFFQDKGL